MTLFCHHGQSSLKARLETFLHGIHECHWYALDKFEACQRHLWINDKETERVQIPHILVLKEEAMGIRVHHEWWEWALIALAVIVVLGCIIGSVVAVGGLILSTRSGGGVTVIYPTAESRNTNPTAIPEPTAIPVVEMPKGNAIDHSGGYCTAEIALANKAATRVGEIHIYGDALNKCHIAKDVTGLNAAQKRSIRDKVGGLLPKGRYSLVAGGLWKNFPNPPSSLDCTADVTILKWYRTSEITAVGNVDRSICK